MTGKIVDKQKVRLHAAADSNDRKVQEKASFHNGSGGSGGSGGSAPAPRGDGTTYR